MEEAGSPGARRACVSDKFAGEVCGVGAALSCL
jgi:hypothetical protein